MKSESTVQKIDDVNDFVEIMEIEKKAFVDPFTKDLYLSDFLNHPYSVYYKLVLKDKIIGYIGLWIMYEDVQITTFAIDPTYQGLGYGSVLMDFTVNLVKEKKCQNITLEVRVSNDKAIQLYEKYHFNKVAKRKRYYPTGEDAYLMELVM
ncbi:ribosomal protein S18-alanine N-acetyltransferase [Mycoplasmatota bacterium]|nr:ribosomal protein S18-alanine N-acetyltransferase [Mycoplasmatota bacterium]